MDTPNNDALLALVEGLTLGKAVMALVEVKIKRTIKEKFMSFANELKPSLARAIIAANYK